MNFKQISVIIIFLSLLQPTFAQPWFFSKNIGIAKAVIKPDAISLGNNVLNCKWVLKGNSIHADIFRNKLTNIHMQWNNTDWFMYSYMMELCSNPAILNLSVLSFLRR